MVGMKLKFGTVDAEVGTPDGRLLVRVNDRWLLADELGA